MEKKVKKHRKEKKMSPVQLAALVVGLAIVGLIGFRAITKMASNQKRQPTERAFSVAVLQINPQIFQEYFRVNGDIMAENTINIIPDTSGKLMRYTVKVGQNVQRGQVVAYLDPSRPGMQFALNPVTAPLSGTITSLPIELGNTVTQQSVVAQMGDLSRLKIETYIPERFIKDLHIGSQAHLSLSAYPGKSYSAAITELAPVVDPLSRTVLAKLNLTENNSDLMAGMFGSLKIDTMVHENALVVPASAVVNRSGKNYLFVAGKTRDEALAGVQEGAMTPDGLLINRDFDALANQVEVELGATVDGNVLVMTGLKAGDKVVTAGQNVLSQDSKLKFLKSEKDDADNSNDTVTDPAPAAESSEKN